jgi:hypothetical protein
MRKLSLWVAFIGIALAIATSAHARGGTNHHADPVFFKTVDKQPVFKPVEQKAHHQAPVTQRSPHRHHH